MSTADLARELNINSAVWVHAFGAWRRGIVIAIGRTRLKVRYVSNNTTLAEREKWFGAGDSPVLDGILPGPRSWPCTPCGHAIHGRPGVTLEQLRDDHNARSHPRPAGAVTYRVVFDRIGRSRGVPDLITRADGANHLAEQIYRYARPHLVSSDVDVAVDLKAGTGAIICGFQIGGTFTVAVEPDGGDVG